MKYKKTIASIISILIAIILMITPFGVAMKFSSGPDDNVTHYYSYFSTMPLGYANWFPAITAFFSIIIITILIIDIKNFKMRKLIHVFLYICIAGTILSWVIFNSFTIISFLIMMIHLFVLALLLFPRK